ncbi:MAG: hypothetical protein U1D26_00210 [Patescibacteria group bacterium]|nr:hypothetical protein [Patescibacteria group bacterium]
MTGGPIAGTQPAPTTPGQQPTFPQPQPQYPTYYGGGFSGGGGGGILSGFAGLIGSLFNPQPAPEPPPAPTPPPAPVSNTQSITQIVYLSQLVAPNTSTTVNVNKQQFVSPGDSTDTATAKNTNIPVTDFNRITFLAGQAPGVAGTGSVDDVLAKIRAFAGITDTGSASDVGRAGRAVTAQQQGTASGTLGTPSPSAGPLANSYALDSALLTGGGQPWNAIRGRAPSAITFIPYEPLTVSGINQPDGLPASAFDNSIIAYNSGWITSQREFLQARLSLEQAKSNYEIAKAAISAWQQAEEVGLCGETCRLSLETLLSQMPAREARVRALEDIVSRGISAVPQVTTFGADRQGSIFGPDSPLQGIADIAQMQPDTQGGTTAGGGPGISSGTEGSQVVGGTSVTDIPQTQPAPTATAPSAEAGATQADGTLPDVLTRVAGVFTALFEEPTPSAAPTCSLLSSLFGGCEGW